MGGIGSEKAASRMAEWLPQLFRGFGVMLPKSTLIVSLV